ncbi:CUB domain [Trinorchestia longiramus]|nr:CUB domain [Trinorchestia longiramus]
MLVSHFVSRTFTTTSAGTGECKLTVNPRHNNICQYRLDFDSFNIAQPDLSSDCTQDFFGVTGGSMVPKLCGDLTGQHIYVNVEPGGGPIILTMDTSKTLDMKRDWNVKITQIDCDSPYRAPAGCLQFYNETSGLVKSMNFKGIDPPDEEGSAYWSRTSTSRRTASQSHRTGPSQNNLQTLASPSKIILSRDEIIQLKDKTLSTQQVDGTDVENNYRTPRFRRTYEQDMRQIQSLNYGVCINAKVGYCDVTWTQSKAHGAYSFTMSGDASVPSDQLKSEFGVENCLTDYVSINGGVFVDPEGDTEIHAVRYCGTKFPEVKTKAQPYVLHVTTDVDEGTDRRNLGFAINFRQNLC